MRGSEVGAGDQLVDAGGLALELAQERALLVGKAQFSGMADWGLAGGGVDFADQGTEIFEDIVDRLDEPSSVADEAMASAAGDAVDRAGDAEDLAVLLHRVVGRGQRPAPRRRLDDDETET
jgi:hypothetical protein